MRIIEGISSVVNGGTTGFRFWKYRENYMYLFWVLEMWGGFPTAQGGAVHLRYGPYPCAHARRDRNQSWSAPSTHVIVITSPQKIAMSHAKSC